MTAEFIATGTPLEMKMYNGHRLELSREARTHVHPADNDSARVRSAVCPSLYFHGRTPVLLCPSLPALCSSEWISISMHHISGLRCPLAAASGKPHRRSERSQSISSLLPPDTGVASLATASLRSSAPARPVLLQAPALSGLW